MKRYIKYKNSGIEWIGKIPEHWEVKKLKYVALANPSSINKKAVKGEREIFLCNYTDVYNNDFINSELSFMRATANNAQIEKFLLEKDDVIITKDSETLDDIGVPALVIENLQNVVCGYHLTHIKPKNIQGSFIFRFFQTKLLNSYFEISANGITRYGLGINKINSAPIFIPSYEEQTTIASYLDRKTAEIDELITKKERLLQLYEEEKTALINQAVTKGLNPHVPMKDSGIDWLGEIPEHWEVKQLSYLFNKIGSGTTPKSDNPEYYENGLINWLQTGDLNDDEIYYTSKRITERALKNYSTLRFYPVNSIVIAMYGATIGKTGILKIETTTNQACCVLAEPKNIEPKFMFYWFNSVKKLIISLSYGGGQPNINQEMIRVLRVQLPSRHEQAAIVQYIEKETVRIEAKVAKTKKLIELLKEYKTALISEVVTGKVKVV